MRYRTGVKISYSLLLDRLRDDTSSEESKYSAIMSKTSACTSTFKAVDVWKAFMSKVEVEVMKLCVV